MTDGCNLTCRYCFEREKPQNACHYQFMSQTVAEGSLLYLLKYSPYDKVFVNLYGGEPLLNFKTIKYLLDRGNQLAKEYRKEIFWFLITNGTLLNQEIANFIKDRQIGVQISLDGSKEDQDSYRTYKDGRASYPVVIRNIRTLESLGVSCNLMVVLHKKNISDISWLNDLRSLVTGKVGFCVTAAVDKEITPDEREWKDFCEHYKSYLMATETNGLSQQHAIPKIIGHIKNGGKFHFGCGGGLEEFTVTPDGEMYLCERLSGKLGCNILEDMPPHKLWKKYINDVTNDECGKCWAKYLCGGGCAHTFYSHTGTKKPYHWACRIKKAEVESAVGMLCHEFYKTKSVEGNGHRNGCE